MSDAPISSLHVIGSRALGGAENFYIRLITALHEAGQPVAAVNPPASGVGRALQPGIVQYPLTMRSVFDPIARWRIDRLVRRHRPAIVQTYMGRATRLTHLRPGRSVVHVARLGGYYHPKGYRHAHAWIGNTRGIRDYLVDAGFPAERVFYIGNFVEPAPPADPDDVAALRHRLGLNEDATVLLALGRLHPNKGFDMLLEAFAQLRAQPGNDNLHLIVVGDGPLRDTLHAHTHRLGLQERVHWPGWCNTPRAYFSLAALFICPSRHEPLGNVILEAWAHGTPVISTSTQGAEELITPGHDGLMTELEDPTALADAVQNFLRMPMAKRQHLADNGRQTLAQKHSKHAVVQRYLEVYRQLVET